MTREEVKAFFARRNEALAQGDVTTLMESYADDCAVESPSDGALSGRAAVGRTFQHWFTAFRDLTFQFLDLMITGDRVVQQLVLEGTDTGGFLGQRPSGRPFRFFLVLLYTMNNRRIVHERRVYDVNGLLLQLADQGSAAQTAMTMYRAALERARLEHEVRTAAEIQGALLPERQMEGIGFDLAATSLPCRAIGGDFFDYFDLPSGALGFALGDVAGKGPPAALLAARLQGILAVQSSTTETPSEIAERVNKALTSRTVESRFATMFYGVLSRDGRLTYSNAGHNPPFLVGSHGLRRLDTGGSIVGAFKEATYEEETVQLDPGDVLVVYSDGVTEALNGDDAEFGEERLMSCVSAHRETAPTALVELVLASVREFTLGTAQNDDVTVLVLRYRGTNTG